MQKLSLLVLSVLIISLLAACSATATEPEAHAALGGEGITDATAKELFEKATAEIRLLSSESPLDLVNMILGNDIEIVYEEKTIDGVMYYETTAAFQDLKDYYAKLFTGEALTWILSTKFADVDGTLYCSPTGGATGWSIADLEVARTGQSSGSYLYEATFNEFDEPTTSQFTIENTDDGYRISSIDYIPDLLRQQ